MTDATILGVVSAVVSLAGTCFLAVMNFKIAQLKVSTEKGVNKISEVKEVLETVHQENDQKLTKIAETADKTLVHVNDQFLIQLRLNMVLAKRIAENNNPADIEIANKAEQLYNEHNAKQVEARSDRIAIELAKK